MEYEKKKSTNMPTNEEIGKKCHRCITLHTVHGHFYLSACDLNCIIPLGVRCRSKSDLDQVVCTALPLYEVAHRQKCVGYQNEYPNGMVTEKCMLVDWSHH